MKLGQLMEVVAIVEHGSLRAAARQLGLSQPSITRSVRSLERELGTALFERSSLGAELTPTGKLFHRRASVVMQEVRKAREEVQQVQGVMQGTVVAGLSIMPLAGMLPQALPAFKRVYPDVMLKVIEGLFPAIENGLRDGSVDFYMGATPSTPPAPGLLVETLFKNTRIVVGRKGHPLAGAKSLKELASAEWATTSLNRNAQEDLHKLFASRKLAPPRITFQAGSAMSVMVAVAHSDLLAMLPSQWDDFPLAKGHLKLIEIKEKLAAPSIVLVRRAGLSLTPAAETLCDLLRRNVPGR